MVQVVPLFSTQHLKGNTGSNELKTAVMDRIWHGNPSKSKVIGHCGGGEKKRNDHAESTKSETKKVRKRNTRTFQVYADAGFVL